MEKSLDLLTLCNLLFKHIKFVITVTALVTLCAFIFSKIFIVPKYESHAMLYVESKSATSESLSINDISVAQKLVDTCSIIFTSETVMQQLSDDSRIDYTPSELKSMITVGSINSTEIIKITAQCYSPNEATYIANKMVELCVAEYSRIIQSGTITEVTSATYDIKPCSPNIFLNTVIGFLIGSIIACAIVLINELLDTSIKPSDDLAKMYNIPVFAEIMDFDITMKGKNKYKYSYKYSS